MDYVTTLLQITIIQNIEVNMMIKRNFFFIKLINPDKPSFQKHTEHSFKTRKWPWA